MSQITLPVTLPPPAIGNLDLIEDIVRHSVLSQAGRESLVTFISEEVFSI